MRRHSSLNRGSHKHLITKCALQEGHLVLMPKMDAKAILDDRGYVVLDDIIDPKTVLDPIIEEYKNVLNNLAIDLYEYGEIKSTYQRLSFQERLIKLYTEKEDSGTGANESSTRYPIAQYFDCCLPPIGIKEDTPIWCGPAVFNAITHPQLLDTIEQFIGPEIYSNPIQHVRIKPPEKYLPKNKQGHAIVGPTYWHQDQGVTTEDADETTMLTVWFPILDAPVESGPLKVVPGSHRLGLLTHCPNYLGNGSRFMGRNAQIPENLFRAEDAIPIHVKRGSAIFMHKRTVHGSYSNESENIRWSFDLRYNPVGDATGREYLPGFIARSHAHPENELHNPIKWQEMWLEARASLAGFNQKNQNDFRYDRWGPNHSDCVA